MFCSAFLTNWQFQDLIAVFPERTGIKYYDTYDCQLVFPAFDVLPS